MAAGKSFLLQILILSTFSLYIIHTAHSRSLSSPESESHHDSHYTTTVFHVSAAIQRALGVLSFDPARTLSKHIQNQTELGPTTTATSLISSLSNSSSFSLSLHPRSSLLKTHYNDYKSLTLSRLRRDVARVQYLQLAVNRAVNMTSGKKFSPEDLETPVTSGASQGSGEYFVRLGVGTPAKEYYLVIDTGSDISWLQCQPCDDCYKQSDPIFDPSGSSTYRPVTCNSPQCQALRVSDCQSGSCLYQVVYGDKSFTVGEFATETLSFGNSDAVKDFAIGCGHDNEGLFVGAAGLLGLGRESLSLPSQLKATSFSYCLVDRDDSSGSSTLDFNSAPPSDSITAPLYSNSQTSTYFYVGLTGFSVGGKPVDIPQSVFDLDSSGDGGIIVDSGTTVTRLKTQAYNALRDAFVSQTQNLQSAGSVSIFDTCYNFSSMERVEVPTLSFQFSGGKTLPLPARNYLILVDSEGTVCFAFAPTDGSPSIIGNAQQQGTRVSYDLAKNLVGLSPNKC